MSAEEMEQALRQRLDELRPMERHALLTMLLLPDSRRAELTAGTKAT